MQVPITALYAGIFAIVARIAHAIGLKHDNMADGDRFIGAAGTALITLVVACYTMWIAVRGILG